MSPATETPDAPLTTQQRLEAVREAIAVAAGAADRSVDNITLIAVSKTQPAEAIVEAIEAGQIDFGENRVQEAMEKWPAIKDQYPHIRLHLLGPLQRNKLRDALGLFDVFHTVDRAKLAASMARLRDDEAVEMPSCFVQVNTGEEPQKAGVGPLDADEFITECRDMHGLNIVGLMCIPPTDEDAALHFSLLTKIARRNNLASLSMGMSSDYEVAVEMGATHIRVGTAIFGPRRF